MRTLPIMFLLALTTIPACVKEGGDGTKTENHIVVGDNMPGFEIENTLMGSWNGLKSPDDFIGRKTLLVFYTTTCGDCRREMPFAEYAFRELTDEGLTVIPIGRGETPETVDAYWTDMNFRMNRYFDTDRAVFNLFANRGVPRIYLVDETGKVVWMAVEKLGYGEFTGTKGDKFITLIKNQLKL